MYHNDKDLSLIVDENNQLYYYEEKLINYSERDKYYYKDVKKFVLNHPISYTTYAFDDSMNSVESVYYNYYVENNSIYKVVSQQKGSGTIYNTPVLIHEFSNEQIMSLEGKVFKTDKAYYKIGIINQEECNKYEDVKCEEGFLKIEDISNDYKNIEYFNGNYIIYKGDTNLYIYDLYINNR